ncbi:MAG: hypothetical protein HKM06_01555 [Spirochaetales bacterium]|nr:hypothetical protein [Spirochaetales bacterium]
MGFLSNLQEEFTSVWTLLNDTSTALARAKLFQEYENDLRTWRSLLQRRGQDPQVTSEVRQNLKALRTQLRSQGLELILGQKDIVTKGWRHDDAVLDGFRRCVLLVQARDVFWITGSESHGQLKSALGARLGMNDIDSWPGVHSLWFRWVNKTLELSGADSEPAQEWEIFRRLVDEKKNFLIKRLQNLR